jgi:hypothetical protein
MIMYRTILTTVSIAALGVAAAGVMAGPASAAGSHAVHMKATRQHQVTVTPRTNPGWTRLQNTGPLPLLVYAPRGAVGASALAKDLNHAPSSALDKQFLLTTTVDNGAAAYVLLHDGTYFVTDGDHGKARYRASQVAAMHVSGARTDTTLPTANRIPIGADLDPHAKRVLSVHTSFVKLVSASRLVVNVIAVPVDASTSKKIIDAFLKHPSYRGVGVLAKDPYYALAQEAAPRQTIFNDYYSAKGRWMIITQAHEPSGKLQGTLHQGQAELVEQR